jgi:uracil-DNA glycosylase family 4
MSYLSNVFPQSLTPTKLAIIGEAPGPHELAQGRPFCGPTSGLLVHALQNANVQMSNCFRGYIYNQVPPGGDIESINKSDNDFTNSLAILKSDLNKFQPNCVLLLGGTALWAAGIYHKVNVFRGTLFSGFDGRHKCVATFSPGYVNKVWDEAPLFQFDVGRACEESESAELRLPKRTLEPGVTASEVLSRLNAIRPGVLVSVDIEGGVPNPEETTHRNLDGVTCIGISTDPSNAWIIALQDFDDNTKGIIMQAFNKMMANPLIPKVLQNSLYDYTVLAWLWKINARNIQHDTMLSGWEIYPELPKGLGTQASIWSKEPYYKFERTSGAELDVNERRKLHYTYCCKDAAVTLEIHKNHMAAMTPAQRSHYDFNMSLIPSLQYMSLRGIRYNTQAAKEKHSEIKAKMLELQMSCNHHANAEINLNSPKQMCELLYKRFGFEPQYMKEAGRKTTKLTANADAMLKIIIKQGTDTHPFLACALGWKKLEGVRKQLELTTDHDSRVRCSYNLVGTETGRLSCSGSVTGSGTNLQTITKQLRYLYQPDPDHYFFQCDLSGADGWTVASRASMLGDPTMLDDYLAGMKPAKIIALMYMQMQGQLTGVSVNINDLPREEVKRLTKVTDIPESLYAVCKAVQHGSSYDMGPNTMANNILLQTFKKSSELNVLWVPSSDCKKVQTVFFKRYPGVLEWHRWVQQQLLKYKTLSCASGHVRTFFGRPGNDQTNKAAYAHEPQANTTYATNLAMQKLWLDPDNRTSTGDLIIQPLHSVHDALCGQFPIDRADWAVKKIQSYFNNTLSIGNDRIVIPFEGGYGQSWFHTEEKYRIGEI